MKRKEFVFTILLVLIIHCESKNNFQFPCSTPKCKEEAENLNSKLGGKSFDPCDDFYSFACGDFSEVVDNADELPYASEFELIEVEMLDQLTEALKSPLTSKPPFDIINKLYSACTNDVWREAFGLEPAKEIIESLGGWPMVAERKWNGVKWPWQKVISKLDNLEISSEHFFKIAIYVDIKNLKKRSFYASQGKLGLDQDLLLEGLDNPKVIAYYNFQVNAAVLFGAKRVRAELEAKEVLEFEMELAKFLTSPNESKNLTSNYIHKTITEWQQLFPIYDWVEFFNNLYRFNPKVTEKETVIVSTLKYFKPAYDLLMRTPNRVIVNYLIWQEVLTYSTILNKKMEDLYFQFAEELSGTNKFLGRPNRCSKLIFDHLPIAMSSLYVRKYMSKETKQAVNEMFESIRKEFIITLETADWMDRKTKSRALKKAKNIEVIIGYPDEILDNSKIIEYYKGLKIHKKKYFDSMRNIDKFNRRKMFNSLRKPANRNDWEMHSALGLVRAYHMPVGNSIHLSAGMLQKHFFSIDRPAYMNYGGIGFTIGHELAHGFCGDGHMFDFEGNFVDSWWEEETKVAYEKKAQCIIDQYGNFTDPIVNLPLNGFNTQEENIADAAAFKLAYLAYTKFVAKNGVEAKLSTLPYSQNQIFWITAAQTHCSVYQPDVLKKHILEEVHSPDRFRVLGPFSNSKEFAADFNCSPDSKMNAKSKCEFW